MSSSTPTMTHTSIPPAASHETAPGSAHSTPASYTSSTHHHQNHHHHHVSHYDTSSFQQKQHNENDETHTPNSSSPSPSSSSSSSSSSSHPVDLSNLQSHPIYAAMFQDPDLPIANISRIMKRSLPENAKIAKDAKECVQDCVSELISFITSEASDKCSAEKRKTINGDDILYAMRVLGFDNYEEILRVYLSRYRMDQEINPKIRKRSNPPSRPNLSNHHNNIPPHLDDQDEDDDDDDDINGDDDVDGENSKPPSSITKYHPQFTST